MSYYQVFDAFQDAVLVVDREGCVYYGNSAASLLLEVSARRLSSGRQLSQFMSLSPDLVNSGEALASIQEMTQSREVEFQLPNGRTGWVQVVLQPEPQGFGDGQEPRWIMTLRDVTLEKTLHSKYKAELDQKEAVIADLKEARAALEQYSQKLELMVEERTLELSETNALLKSILDSLGQGILVFEKDGRCLDVYSQVWRKLFGSEPSGKCVEEAIGLPAPMRENFAEWRDVVFQELLDFDDLRPLAPSRLSSPAGLEIAFDYHPMRSDDGHIRAVVLVATDKTREIQALREAEREHAIAGRVTQVARHREAFRLYIAEAKRIIGNVLGWPENAISREEIARDVHTLKGGSASFYFMPVVRACDEYENLLASLGSGGAAELDMKEKLADAASEISRAFETEVKAIFELLGPIVDANEASTVEVPLKRLREWSETLRNAVSVQAAREIGDRIIRELTERPMISVIDHLESSLRELAEGMGKKLDAFVIEGGETTAPAYIARGFGASLVHAFRNSVYHGLETPEERLGVGKPEGGRIVARFARTETPHGSRLRIEIEDDGRGVDHEKVRAKLIEQGFTEAAELSPHEIVQTILKGDLSTTEKVDSVAGRGVGLSAIANEVKRLGGRVVIHSELGKGMRLEIEIPLRVETDEARERKAA